MPFPWKKGRSTRISRLVNDHLQNSQRGSGRSSLMVETGFPTSLVDLFIKHREKLKRSAKKMKPTSPPEGIDLPISGSSPSPVASPSYLSPLASPLRSPLPSPLPSRSASELELDVGGDGEPHVGGDGGLGLTRELELDVGGDGGSGLKRRADANGFLLGAMKMFFVLVLAFGTKKFAVGFTFSAFLLFFVDLVWKKHVFGWLRPSSGQRKGLSLVEERVRGFFSLAVDRLCWKNGGLLESRIQQGECFKSGCSALKSCGSVFPIQRTQVVEQKCDLPRVDEIQCEEEVIKESGCNRKVGAEEGDSNEVVMEKEESTCEVLELERSKSRRAKIKLKMMKLIPKKLRSIRRKEDNSESSEISLVKEDEIVICEEQEVDEYEDARVSESCINLSLVSSEICEGIDVAEIYCSGELSKGNQEAALDREEERTGTGQNWRYYTLCLIVLAGLIGGRTFALSLTLLWCFFLKSGETILRYIKKEPTISCFTKKRH